MKSLALEKKNIFLFFAYRIGVKTVHQIIN
jgi:hypothetical protein